MNNLVSISYVGLQKMIESLPSSAPFPKIYIERPIPAEKKEKRKGTPNALYAKIQQICCRNGMKGCFYFGESRKGWRRIKFMEFHRVLTQSQIRVILESVNEVLSEMDLLATHLVDDYQGFCHGPYTAIVLKVKKS